MPKISRRWESNCRKTGIKPQTVQVEPVEELILELTDPVITEKDGVRRADGHRRTDLQSGRQ